MWISAYLLNWVVVFILVMSSYKDEVDQTDNKVDLAMNHVIMLASVGMGIIAHLVNVLISPNVSKFFSCWPRKYHILDPPIQVKNGIKIFSIILILYSFISNCMNAYFNISVYSKMNKSNFFMIIFIPCLFVFMSQISLVFIMSTGVHISFCFYLTKYYKIMIQKINNVKDQKVFITNQTCFETFTQIRVQHCKLISSTKHFMETFGSLHVLTFLYAIIQDAILIYLMVYNVLTASINADTIFYQRYVWLFGVSWPLFALCISSDIASNEVRSDGSNKMCP